MNMHIFNRFLVFIFAILIVSSCQKDDVIYDINQLQSSSYNANKNKLKSVGQYISIVYASKLRGSFILKSFYPFVINTKAKVSKK